MPVPDIGITSENYYDKIVHVFLFGIFSYLFYFNLRSKFFKKILFSAGVGVIFSLLIELLQLFVPGRDASFLDFLAGVIGVLVFLTIAYAKNKK